MPGAYYSDPASVVFTKLETAIETCSLAASALGRLATELEHLLPSPTEAEIERAFADVMGKLGLANELDGIPGKRVALRMVVTIANARAQPVVRESGVMRLPQTIQGLFESSSKGKSPPTPER